MSVRPTAASVELCSSAILQISSIASIVRLTQITFLGEIMPFTLLASQPTDLALRRPLPPIKHMQLLVAGLYLELCPGAVAGLRAFPARAAPPTPVLLVRFGLCGEAPSDPPMAQEHGPASCSRPSADGRRRPWPYRLTIAGLASGRSIKRLCSRGGVSKGQSAVIVAPELCRT
jgi:hypothetical protein